MSLTEFEKSQLKTWCLDISLHLKGSKSSLDTLLERATKIHAFITDAPKVELYTIPKRAQDISKE